MFASNFPVDAMHGTFDELFSAYDGATADLDADAARQALRRQRRAALPLLRPVRHHAGRVSLGISSVVTAQWTPWVVAGSEMNVAALSTRASMSFDRR